MSTETARTPNGAPNAQGSTDPVYELAPINYKLIYDYALVIRECLVRGKPEMLDEFLYSSEILSKVFTGCRVGCDFASEPHQPTSTPQQLRCTACNIVKTPEWRKGPLGKYFLIWGKMSRDRAAKTKAEAAAKAAASTNAVPSVTVPTLVGPVSSASSQAPDERRDRRLNSSDDSLSSSALPFASDNEIVSEAVVTMSAPSMKPVRLPSATQTSKRERDPSFDSGDEPDREDSGDRAKRGQPPFRAQSPPRVTQRRRLITRPQERKPMLLLQYDHGHSVGDMDEDDDDDMPLPDLVRCIKRPSSSSSRPATIAVAADSVEAKKPTLLASNEAAAKGKPVTSDPPANRLPAIPNLSFVSRRVFNGPMVPADIIEDAPVVVNMIGDKTETLVERLVIHAPAAQESNI
ncbi:hypothetical protein DFQ26_000029 [Actinomortierella ambigua]|nr:hypothetical protein DFQ26_000029 [Actinomortierella ambigua]